MRLAIVASIILADWDMCSGRNGSSACCTIVCILADWDMCSGRNTSANVPMALSILADWDMCSGRNFSRYRLNRW
jgi:hypothetical protein